MKNDPHPLKIPFWLSMRLVFTAVCLAALAALLMHPQDLSAATARAHIHTSAASDLAVVGSTGTQSDPPQGGAAPTEEAAQNATAVVVESGQSPSGRPVSPPAEGGGAAATSKQRSLSDAAAEPDAPATEPNSAHGAPVLRGTVDPSQVLDGASQSLGGCQKEYGEAGQCLPVVPPSLAEHLQQMKNAREDPASMPHNWTCREVRIYFPNGIAVRQQGVDPQRLDANRDGTACGSAD